MFQGYLRFAGVEVANAARTAAYARNMLPGIGFHEVWDADSLPCILGDGTYRTPILDAAPWFSESRPESGKFLGFYPLSIEGIEDSSRDISVTELTTDGAVFSLPRRASKDFRVRGVLIGEDQQGVDAGMRWLKGALDGSECSDGNCTGDSLCYLAYLPQCCNYSDTATFPVQPVNFQWTAGDAGGWTPYLNGTVDASTNGVLLSMPCSGDGAQYYVEGLVPGQPYRLTLEMASSTPLALHITGRFVDSTTRAAIYLDRGRTPWVYDFIAKNETETIRLSNGYEDCTPSSARIYGMTIQRTPVLTAKSLPRFNWDDYTEPSSWTRGSVPTNIVTSVDVAARYAPESLAMRWKNSSGSTISMPIGSYFSRLIRGLEVGRTYSAYINIASVGGTVPKFAIMSAGGVERASTTTPLGSDWYQVTWVADSPQRYLRISMNAAVPITAGASIGFNLNYLRVDINTSRMSMDIPDQAVQATRSMYGVTLLDGPNVISYKRTNAPGVITEVEFSMKAARPFIYSETFNVPLDPAATTFLVGNETCRYGQPVRTNLFTNPFMVSAVSGGVGTYATMAATGGSTALVTNGFSQTATSSTSYVTVPVGSTAFLDGHTYTISATFGQDSAQGAAATGAHPRSIEVITNGSDIVSSAAIDAIGDQRVSVTFVHSGGTQPVIRLWNGANTKVVRWSSFLVERSGIAGSPFSGASLNGAWLGTANQSASTWTQPAPTLISDPNCPPIPNAPQPPSISPACPRNVTEWRRYWIEVPSDLSGGWVQSVPVVTLTTRDNIVRDVRVRLYPNPTGGGVEDVEPCSYCGEFYISYIPQKTVMSIDGIYETAIADVQGTGVQTVMHLVSDADYGPIRWPSMTCDMAYYLTVDIAPDEVLDVDVRLSIAMAE